MRNLMIVTVAVLIAMTSVLQAAVIPGRWEKVGPELSYPCGGLGFDQSGVGWCFNERNGFFLLKGKWRSQRNPYRTHISDVCFADDSGWAVGGGGALMRLDMANKGKRAASKWLAVNKLTSEELNAVDFAHGSEGMAVGANGTVLHYY